MIVFCAVAGKANSKANANGRNSLDFMSFIFVAYNVVLIFRLFHKNSANSPKPTNNPTG